MSDDTKEDGVVTFPKTHALVQGRLVADPKVHSEKFATMRVAVSNSYKKSDGTWDNSRPDSFFDVKINGEAHVKLLQEAMGSGKAVKGGHARVEGFPVLEEYEGREKIAIVARKGQSAFSFDLPDRSKRRANEFTISGNIGQIRPVEGQTADGRSYKFYNLTIADNGKDGKANWYNVVVSAPKAVAVMEAGIADGSIATGAKIAVTGSFEPNKWEQDGQTRQKMELRVKPFEGSLKVLFPAKAKEAVGKEASGEGVVAKDDVTTAVPGKKAEPVGEGVVAKDEVADGVPGKRSKAARKSVAVEDETAKDVPAAQSKTKGRAKSRKAALEQEIPF